MFVFLWLCISFAFLHFFAFLLKFYFRLPAWFNVVRILLITDSFFIDTESFAHHFLTCLFFSDCVSRLPAWFITRYVLWILLCGYRSTFCYRSTSFYHFIKNWMNVWKCGSVTTLLTIKFVSSYIDNWIQIFITQCGINVVTEPHNIICVMCFYFVQHHRYVRFQNHIF